MALSDLVCFLGMGQWRQPGSPCTILLYRLATEDSKNRDVCHPSGHSAVLHSLHCLQFCGLSRRKCAMWRVVCISSDIDIFPCFQGWAFFAPIVIISLITRLLFRLVQSEPSGSLTPDTVDNLMLIQGLCHHVTCVSCTYVVTHTLVEGHVTHVEVYRVI